MPAPLLTLFGRFGGLGLVVALHVVGLWALLQVESVRSAVTEVAPIFVTFVTPAPEIKPPEPLPVIEPRPDPKPIVEPEPEPEPKRIKKAKPKPRPAPLPKVPEPAPIVAAETPTPTPEPTTSAPPAPPPAAPPAPTLAELEPAPPPPPPLEPPRFDMAYLNNPPPEYPAFSRRLGEQGRVLLRVLVDAAGIAQQVEVKESSGSRRLDQAAKEAVKNWRFIPAQRGDQPIEGWALVPINFELS